LRLSVEEVGPSVYCLWNKGFMETGKKGLNGDSLYDEPTDFKIALVKFGIPENKFFLDYAGFRT